jgi:hypothetical protein
MPHPFDFDSSMDDAWTQFRLQLADTLADLEHGDRHVLPRPGLPLDEDTPALIFTVTRAGRIRCGLSSDLPEFPRPVNGPGAMALIERGWRELASGELTMAVGRRHVDKLAAEVSAVVRDHWQVLHPAFFDGPEPDNSAETPAESVSVRPNGPAHLQALVEGVLAQVTCDPITKDNDGDITFTVGGLNSWLRVRPTASYVDLFTMLARDVDTNPHVAAVFDLHDSQWPEVDLVVSHNHAVAQVSIDATVFTPEAFENALHAWFKFMRVGAGTIARDIVRAGVTGGVDEPGSDPVDDLDGLPPALMVLLHLDPDGKGLLAPHEVAEICDYDRDAILHYLRISTDETIAWRRAADVAAQRGDTEEARACLREADGWTQTKETLRAGLRAVVLPDKPARRRNSRPASPDVEALRPD